MYCKLMYKRLSCLSTVCRKSHSKIFKHLQKMEYLGHRKYLPLDHEFQNMKSQFNGQIDHTETPKYASPKDWLKKYLENEESF